MNHEQVNPATGKSDDQQFRLVERNGAGFPAPANAATVGEPETRIFTAGQQRSRHERTLYL